MVRATTPIFSLTIKSVDLTAADKVYVNIRQMSTNIELSGDDLTVTYDSETQATTIKFTIMQTQSLGLAQGVARAQVNWLYTDNGVQLRGATLATPFMVGEQLLTREVPDNG